MNKLKYSEYKKNIKSGDLLVWNKGEESFKSKLVLFIIRLFTLSEYSHVGIAWKVSDRLFIIEATIPRVRIVPLSNQDGFYHIPMKIKWKKAYTDYLLSRVGERYSLREAILGYLGKTTPDDRHWQCAELANTFYKNVGTDFGDANTPSKLVKAILEQTEAELHYVSISK